MAKQLNIFVDNKPGRLNAVTEALAQKGINIFIFTIQDRGDFGLIKLIVDKPEDADEILRNKGFASALKDVVLVSVKDKPGNLHRLAMALQEKKINLTDARGTVLSPSNVGLCCLEVDDIKVAEKALTKAGFELLAVNDICHC
ncbi:MAG: ACT domain-containing protein [Candidatus Omnitrophica bacterium]|nr:ACT domain-containing protein [Candidatus Omnitrophota bacterium]